MSPTARWRCDVEHCTKPAVRAEGECILCDSKSLRYAYLLTRIIINAGGDQYSNAQVELLLILLSGRKKLGYAPSPNCEAEHEITILPNRTNVTALLSGVNHLRNGAPCSLSNNFSVTPCKSFLRRERDELPHRIPVRER
ncbi:hypothetical protein BDW72DRAFT_176184 [Aspergillus terricola var. indicus]